MPFPTIHRPSAADTGGHDDPHHLPLFHRPAAASSSTDHSSYTSHSRKHRLRPLEVAAPAKRQKPSAPAHDAGKRFRHGDAGGASSPPPPPGKHDDAVPQQEGARSEEERDLLSRDEIERCSPSRKDGIDSLVEAQLRYSYCAYLQSLGLRLQMPQTSIGTAMVLCHRFFVRRSHACHDRFLIATAALFLASKYEETPCLLNTVLRASCEICQAQNLAFNPYLLCSDWLNQYRERVIEAEQMILTTLDFELDVHHPYIPLTSVLNKLGLSQTALMNLAWNLVGEGVFSRKLCSCEFLAGGLIMLFMESNFYRPEVKQLARLDTHTRTREHTQTSYRRVNLILILNFECETLGFPCPLVFFMLFI